MEKKYCLDQLLFCLRPSEVKQTVCSRWKLTTIKSTNGTDKFQPLQCCVCPIYYKCVTTSYHQPLPPPLTPAKLWENCYSHSQFSVLMLTQQSLQGAEGRYCECYDPWSVPKKCSFKWPYKFTTQSTSPGQPKCVFFLKWPWPLRRYLITKPWDKNSSSLECQLSCFFDT